MNAKRRSSIYNVGVPSNKNKGSNCPLTPSCSGRLAVIEYISHFDDSEKPLTLTNLDDLFESEM